MPRDPLAWLPLLRHWTHCLGEGPDTIARMVDLAALLPGGPGWSDVQRSWWRQTAPKPRSLLC